jgi:flagellar hook-associated protein 1 FlgK
MSLLALFDTGRSAIFASQTALSVVSNNIANVNTPGYSRQDAILRVANPVETGAGYIGRGVGDVELRRHYDKFIHLQIIGQNHSYGRSYSLEQGLSNIEQVFNEAKDTGLLNPLQEYFSSWHDLSTNPEGQTQRITLLNKADALVQSAKQMEGDLKDALKYNNEEIEGAVARINSITSNIATLNQKITEIEAGNSNKTASSFRDERDMLLNDLAELTGFDWYEDSNASVSVLVNGKSIVNSTQTFQLSTAVDIKGDRNVYLNGVKMDPVLQKGQLGGLLAVRDEIEQNPLHDLRKLIASITKETNILHRTGYGLDGSTNNNFFDPLQVKTLDNSSGADMTSSIITDPSLLTLDEYDITFTDASNYEIHNHQTGALVNSGSYVSGNPINFEGIEVVISGAPAANDSFFISPLTGAIENFNRAVTDTMKIAAASSGLNLPGDNTNALQIAQLPQNIISDLNNASFESYYRGLVSNIGTVSKAATDSLAYDENLLSELNARREAVSGVSLDEEAANLIKYQRAFEAGSRILKITDELLQMVINL